MRLLAKAVPSIFFNCLKNLSSFVRWCDTSTIDTKTLQFNYITFKCLSFPKICEKSSDNLDVVRCKLKVQLIESPRKHITHTRYFLYLFFIMFYRLLKIMKSYKQEACSKFKIRKILLLKVNKPFQYSSLFLLIIEESHRASHSSVKNF